MGRFNTELLGVLRVQPLPAAELYRFGANQASNRSSTEQAIQNIETNVPPGSTHGDEAVTDVGPQRQACAASQGFEFPPHIEATPVVLKHLGSVGSRDCCFGNTQCRRSHRGELHLGSNRAQAPIGRIVGGEAMKFGGWQRLNAEYAKQFGIETPNRPPQAAQNS